MSRWLVAGALGAALTAGLWAWGASRYEAGWQAGRAALELEQRRAAEETRRRMDDAAISIGSDPDDLRERMRQRGGQ